VNEQELSAIRKALVEQYPNRKTFDDYLEYGLWVITATTITYFGAHLLAWLVAS
jgi:hypothetical protein